MGRLDGGTVVVCSEPGARYPIRAPFDPDEPFPEYRWRGVGSERNDAYRLVRRCFELAGLDKENYGMPRWNPLQELIAPGETVVLKPNLVKEVHPRDPEGWRYVLTQGSIVRAVADYVWAALDGDGRVIVADAPQSDSSFSAMINLLGLGEIRDLYREQGLDFYLVDLRQEEWLNEGGVIVGRRRLAGDPEGAVAFDLGGRSEFVDHERVGRYYGADYDTRAMNEHHRDGRHEYLLAGSAVKADVIFSLPKLKTHKKAGITVTLKNLVGLNADKNWLPHHTEGSPYDGGDEHPHPSVSHRVERSVAARFRSLSMHFPRASARLHRHARAIGLKLFGESSEVIRSGNWWGNDTLWRMCLDLNKIILYGTEQGGLREPGQQSRKRHFSLVDGIIAGEAQGPTDPDPLGAGVVVFGVNAVSVDAACAILMGFDPDRIPIIDRAFRARGFPLTDWPWGEVRLLSDKAAWNGRLRDISPSSTIAFEPHFGWAGRIERGMQLDASAR